MAASRKVWARLALTVVGAVVTLQMFVMPNALAAAPTVTSFTPTTGVVGTTVTITGTGFNDAGSVVSTVKFGGTTATTFTVVNDTTITANVPAGATTGAISVTDPENTATSATNFTVTPSPTPTITSFTPTTGAIGSTVTITGTGLTGTTGVTFNGVAASTFSAASDTSLTVTVPAGATTGDIIVTTPGGTATSATPFTVAAGGTGHATDVTLFLRRHLFARGHVTSDLAECQNGVAVDVQRRRRGGGWKVAGSTTTNDAGHYKVDVPDRPGKYRAVVAESTVPGGTETCSAGRSAAARHRHHHH
jgi:IPT/TIG domain